MRLVIYTQSLAKTSGFSVWHIKKKKKWTLWGLETYSTDTMAPLKIHRLMTCAYHLQNLLQSELPFTSSVSLLTRSLEVSKNIVTNCFHDNEWTSENGEEKKDLYSVEHSQVFACFRF